METCVFQNSGKIKFKKTSITTMRKHYPGSATFHNPLHSHWSLPLKEDHYCQANNTNLLIEKVNFFLIDDAMNEKISSMHV